MNGSVFLVTGPRASGKSTCADILHTAMSGSVLLHVDDLFHAIIGQNRAQWAGCEAGLYAVVLHHQLALVRELADGGTMVIVDGTVLPHELAPLSDPCTFSLDVVVLLPPLSECLANEHRPSRTMSVQEDKVRTTWREMQEWRNVHMPSVRLVDAPTLQIAYVAAELCKKMREGF